MKEIIDLLKQAQEKMDEKGFDFNSIDMDDLYYRLERIIDHLEDFDEENEKQVKES